MHNEDLYDLYSSGLEGVKMSLCFTEYHVVKTCLLN